MNIQLCQRMLVEYQHLLQPLLLSGWEILSVKENTIRKSSRWKVSVVSEEMGSKTRALKFGRVTKIMKLLLSQTVFWMAHAISAPEKENYELDVRKTPHVLWRELHSGYIFPVGNVTVLIAQQRG